MTAEHSSAGNPLYESFLRGAPGRPVIHKWHHYFDVYEAHFAPFRGKAPTVLEIGVQNGGSLRLWREYFGPEARLFGADIDPACVARAPADSQVFIGDQADPEFLKRVLEASGPPDIVIDDGGHRSNQMIQSFRAIYPAMRAPGVYLVEDTHTQFWGGSWVEGPDGNFLDFAYRIARSLNDWTGKAENFAKLHVPPERRTSALPASFACKTTHSVSFYDSVVVFARRDRPEPYCEFRVQDPSLDNPPHPFPQVG